MVRTFRLPHLLRQQIGPLLRRSRAKRPSCFTALSNKAALEAAVSDLSRQLKQAGQRGSADLALVFCSTAYATDLQRLLPLLREAIPSRQWIGCAGGGVVGTDPAGQPHELEHQPGISVSLFNLPGSQLELFHLKAGTLPDLDGPSQHWIDWVGASADGAHSMLLFIDPGCPAINDLISGLDYAYPQAAKVGGIAGQHSASHGSLLLGDQVVDGAVGCLISGAWRIEPVVAQGCRPIGPVFEVEQAERNVVQRLSDGQHRGTPVACLQTILEELSPKERELVRHSLFLGVAKNSFQLSSSESPDASAFLVRNLIGVDPRSGSVAVGERLRVGQRVQFQLRDAEASRQEQRQLLSRQHQRQPEPLAALLFACLGRGEGLYGHPDGDVTACREQFAAVPVTGAFCNGEIGPVAGTTHLHGYTASWGFLVPNTDPTEASRDTTPDATRDTKAS
jgi:small ligand-binding sensory domain FIST